MSLDIQIFKSDKQIIRIHLGGSLDSNSAPKLDVTIKTEIDDNTRMLILDMEKLDYISSAGIRSVLLALKIMKRQNGRLGLANRQPQIVKVFEIMAALPDLKVFSSEQELDAYLLKMQRKVQN